MQVNTSPPSPLSSNSFDTRLVVDDNVITAKLRRRLTLFDGFLISPFIQLSFFAYLALTILILYGKAPDKAKHLYDIVIRAGIMFLFPLVILEIICFFSGIMRFFIKVRSPIISLSKQTFQPFNDKNTELSFPLKDISHLEVLSISNESMETNKRGKFVKWKRSVVSYELNLVLNVGQRFNLLTHGKDSFCFKNTTSFLQDATTLAKLLNIPILDGEQRPPMPIFENAKSRKAYAPAHEHLSFSQSSVNVSIKHRFSVYCKGFLSIVCILTIFLYLSFFLSTLMKGAWSLMWLSLVGILLSLFSIISNLIESDSDDRDFPCFDFSSQAFYPNSISINDSIPFAQIHHLELNCRIFPRTYENDEAKMEAQKQSKHTFVAAYELNVITQDNSRFNILYTKDLQSLSQEAKKLADILNVPFLFYEGNPVVLKE